MNQLAKLAANLAFASTWVDSCMAQPAGEILLTTSTTPGGGKEVWPVGTSFPSSCNELAVGSMTGIFCPELSYLMHTDELQREGFAASTNFLDSKAYFKNSRVFSLSKEVFNSGDLILVKNSFEVWRVTATRDELGQEKFVETLIFKLRVLQDVRSIEVFDSFALVIFEDETVLLAVRPLVEGEYAQYNSEITDVGSTQRPQLDYETAPIEYHSVTGDTSSSYDYILNILSRDAENLQYLTQEGIVLDVENRTALFQQIKGPQIVNLENSFISQIKSNKFVTVISFHTENGGNGFINVLDSQTLTQIKRIDGTAQKRAVGEYIHLQEDLSSGGVRIWYSTEDSIIAANVVKYGQEMFFEDEISIVSVPGGVSSDIGSHNEVFLFGTAQEDQTMSFYSFMACRSGQIESTKTPQGASQRDRSCIPCTEGYYSTGLEGDCIECSFIDRFKQSKNYMKNIIDYECKYTDVLDNEVTAAIIEALANSEAEGNVDGMISTLDDAIEGAVSEFYNDPEDIKEAKSTAWVAIPIILSVLIVISIAASIFLCVKGQCCDRCYNSKFTAKYRKPVANLPVNKEGRNGGSGDKSNYNSLTKDKNGLHVDGTKAERPSILNFDITGDVHGDLTDIEGDRTADATAAASPQKPKIVNHQRGGKQTAHGSGMHSRNNSDATNIMMDPMTQTTLRQGTEPDHNKDSTVRRELNERNLTQPKKLERVDEENPSLQSFQFQAFRAPSETTENRSPNITQGQKVQAPAKAPVQDTAQDVAAPPENDMEWMYEDTEPEEYQSDK